VPTDVFFSTPSMAAEIHIPPGKRFGLGGLVRPGSVVRANLVLVGGGLVLWLHGRRKAKAGSDTGSETEFQSRPCMEAILAARGAAKPTGRARSFCVNGLGASGDDYLTALAFR
jgi:hypothetical protein